MNMKTNSFDRLLGQHCKIVLKESNEERTHIIIGRIHEVDHGAKFIIIKTFDGFGCINFDAIIAIKPKTLV